MKKAVPWNGPPFFDESLNFCRHPARANSPIKSAFISGPEIKQSRLIPTTCFQPAESGRAGHAEFYSTSGASQERSDKN